MEKSHACSKIKLSICIIANRKQNRMEMLLSVNQNALWKTHKGGVRICRSMIELRLGLWAEFSFCSQHHWGQCSEITDDSGHWEKNQIAERFLLKKYQLSWDDLRDCVLLHDNGILCGSWGHGSDGGRGRSCQAGITLNGIQPLHCNCHCGSWAGNDLTWPRLLIF